MGTGAGADTGTVRVFRRPAYWWFSVLAGVAFYGIALVVASPSVGEPTPAFVISGVVVFLWALGWDSSFRCTDSHVSSVNLLVTTTVPWADVQKVTLDGALAITLKDGEELGSVAFGGSLLGEMTGYRTHRRAFEELRRTHRKARAARRGDPYRGTVRRKVTFAWRRLLCAIAVVYVPLTVVAVL
ncbi:MULTISPECIES: hypothetical protein [unclassified Streptomyces]|uniref:hypothetical protein n=1 Tax=unclassified Streptomyces TaxID=2593676 RepID=UPI000A9B3478|nr:MULTISPECIES: hypothetical protein [unclassified Streptomyces]